MRIDNENIRVGNQAEILLDRNYNGTVIDRNNNGIKLDYLNRYGQHKRDQWVPLRHITSCIRTDIDEFTKGSIIDEIRKVYLNDKIYPI